MPRNDAWECESMIALVLKSQIHFLLGGVGVGGGGNKRSGSGKSHDLTDFVITSINELNPLTSSSGK